MEESDSLYIDLGHYIEVLFRQWRLIVGSMLVCILAAALVTLTQPKTYQARVLVASTKTLTSVSFGSSIETLSEEQISGAFNLGARLGTYVQLVKNPAIAEDVLRELGDRLSPSQKNVSSLLEMVNGDLAEKSDAIEIIVENQDPVLARDIANAWANAFVTQVNAIYSEGGANESYASVKGQLVDAKETYDKSQAELESFLAGNRANEYQRQINERQAMIDNLSTARTLSASTIISNTMLSQLTVFSQQVGDLATQLTQVYSDTRKVDRLLMDARDMRDQVKSGGLGAVNSNALALTLLKSQVFASNEGAPDLLVQTNPVASTPDETVADLSGLISTLQARQSALKGQIQVLSSQLLSAVNTQSSLSSGDVASELPPADQAAATLQSLSQLNRLESVANLDLVGTPMEQKIQQLEGQVSELQSQFAQGEAREQELTRARDLAWETYKTLATKEAELRVASQTKGTEVALAAPAAVPQADAVSGTKNVALAALVGLMLGIGAAYFIEFWWSYKGLQPQPITLIGIFRGIELKPVPAEKRSP
jgi:uncharacterized protein involved in exopolysaccharide biosynthesis